VRTKDDTAQLLANAHFALDQSVTRIFRLVEADESNDRKPVKLLEVNPMTTEVGIVPVGMNAEPGRGIFHASVVVEVSPDEFDRLCRGELQLPHAWELGQELFPSRPVAGAIS
jgi:hypothetical protein